MRMFPIRTLIIKELKERKYRYIITLILLFVASGLFFIPGIMNFDLSFSDVVADLMPIYTFKFPALKEDILRKMIRIDITLPFLILVPAFTSPFLGALEGMINEKETHTLEGLLTLPISDIELLIGKMGASLMVGIGLAWIMSFYHFLLISHLSSFKVSQHLLSTHWLLLVFILAPLISIFVNSIGMILAVRIHKLNTAANLGILILSPFFGFLLLVNFGKIILEINLIIKLSVLLVILGLGAFIAAKILLNRESLVLRY